MHDAAIIEVVRRHATARYSAVVPSPGTSATGT